MKLSGKNIIITGASSGIGLDVLKKLSRRECRIIAVARTIDKIEFSADNVIKYPCDISNAENVDKLFNFALKKFGKVDIFIANAGFAYYEKLKEPDWVHLEEIYRTNLFSSIYSAEKMKYINNDQPYRVVITASAMSFLPVPGYAVYASTKAAIHGFARAYRFELQKDQKLQLVYPISTRTHFFEEASEDTPIGWPVQSSEHVAGDIVKGLLKDRNSIFPSRIFWALNMINRILPFTHPFIAWFESLKLKKWAEERNL